MALGTRQFLQDNNVPASKIQSFTIKNYTGGLRNVGEFSDIDARDINNMMFTDGVYMEKRTGITDSGDINAITDTDKIITFRDIYKPYTGNPVELVFTNSKMYKIVNKVPTFVRNVSGKVQGTNFYGKYYFVDGLNIFMYDGTTCLPLKDPPAGYTPAPAPAKKGTFKSDANNFWYEPCAAEVADVFLGENVIPKKPKYIVSRKNRLYVSGCLDDPNNVYITDIENGQYFAVLLPMQPTPNGEKVVGLKVFQDVLIVAREESMFAIYGVTNRTTFSDVFTMKQITTHTGCASGDSMSIANNYLFYLGTDGIVYRMMTPLTDVRQLTTAILSAKLDLYKAPFSLEDVDMKSAISLYHNNNYYLNIGSKLLIYNYTFQAWTLYTSVNPKFMYIKSNKVYFSRDDGKLYRFKVYNSEIQESDPQEEKDETLKAYADTINSVDSAIDAYYTTKRFDLGQPTYFKFFRDIYVIAKTFKFLKSQADITFEIDYADVKNKFSAQNSMSIFGQTFFGDLFINKDIVESLPSRIGRRGRTISMKIQNNIIYQPMKIMEVSGDYTLRGRR